MKRLTTLLLAFLCILNQAYAQKLRPTIRQEIFDTWTADMIRYDRNNVPCALIRVQYPHPGITFEGNVMGDVAFNGSAYLVYATAGTKMLNINAPGYYPLRLNFHELGIGPIVSKGIYTLILEPEGESIGQPTVEANYLILKTSPTETTVEVDGKAVATNDGMGTALLRLGTHTWKAHAPGFTPQEGTLKISPEQKTQLNISLKSLKATVAITTHHEAKVSINGTPHGHGSQTLELFPGIYNVELRIDGHRPYTTMLELSEGELATINHTEFTPIFGILNIDFRPVGATITIDNKSRGETPAMLSDILIGKHTVTISAPGHSPKTQTVTISPDMPTTLSGTLEKGSEYSTTPTNLTLCVKIDGKYYYLSQDQWVNMDAGKRANAIIEGMCIIGDNQRFILSLKEDGGPYNWYLATKKYGDKLPTKAQADVIVKFGDELKRLISTYGGDVGHCYCVRDEKDSDNTWFFTFQTLPMLRYEMKKSEGGYCVHTVERIPGE